ncbi:MAG TPA: efflux RND transporter periplasmic adaptor subunit [Novosphingobium sp.]|nr:efflux RND transporter periplasmic adaptor subunit [Novosphingobium sp.]
MNQRLVASAAVLTLLAGGAGVLIGRSALNGAPSPKSAEGTLATTPSNESGRPGHVAINAAQIGTAGIELITVGESSEGAELIAQGTVASTPNGLAVLTAGAAGRVTAIDKRLGDPVGRGERVATLESRDAALISADSATAAAKLRLARATFERERHLYEAKVTARADFEEARAGYEVAQAEAARANAAVSAAGVSGRFIAVRSPIAGRITASSAVLGSFVGAENELFRIANPSAIQIEAALPIRDAERVRPGDAARIQITGGTIGARVRAVTPSANLESRAATVVLELSRSAAMLQPGQFVRVAIVARTGDSNSVIVVPEEAVQSIAGRDSVFVRTRDGFVARPVSVASRNAGQAQIALGLKPGEIIAGRNAFLIKTELEKSAGEEE